MPRGRREVNRYTRFIRPHATYVYTGGRVIREHDTMGQLRRNIHDDDFSLMSLEQMAMWLDAWEERV